MIYLTHRRPRGKHCLTNHQFEYWKSICCRDHRPPAAAVQRAHVQVERFSIGGWR
jgi:hypothetical protein